MRGARHMQRVMALSFSVGTILGLLATSACAGRAPLHIVETVPIRVERPLDVVATDFRRMLYAYVLAETGERELVIEVEPIRNTMLKDLTADVSPLVRDAIERISGPFRTVRSVIEVGVGALARGRPDGRGTDYRITGSILEAFDTAVIGADRQGDGMAKRPPVDGGARTGTRRTTTSLVIVLTLENAAGEGIPGASATYRISLDKVERERSFSVYVAGNGFSWGSNRALYQDPAAALQDALTIAVPHLLGHAFLLPYWRTSPVYTPDQPLIDRFHSWVRRKTPSELEHQVKTYLQVSGWPMDPVKPTLTERDAAVAVAAMRQSGIDPADPAALVSLASRLWLTLDYRQTAPAVERRLDDIARQQRTLAETKPSSPPVAPGFHISPNEFDWHSSTSMVVVDVGGVKDPATRRQIASVLQRMRGAAEVRQHPVSPMIGVRGIRNPAEIQATLRKTGLGLEFRWLTDAKGQEYLVLKLS